ncbi:MAG: YtxH domain-containing protein [Schumannella sp.]
MGLDDIVDKAKDAAEAVKDKAGDAADAVKEKAGDAADAVKEKAGDVKDAVKDKAGDVRDAAHDAVHSDRAEKISDAVLDGGEAAANFVTGGKLEEKIGDIRDDLDAKVGNDGESDDATKGGGGR